MRLLHIGAGNLYGGIETVLATLARNRSAAPDLHQHFAVCFEGRLATELVGTGASVEILGPVRASRPWTWAAARRKLGRILSREAFDVVACHGSWVHATFGSTISKTAARLVLWLHGPVTGRHWLERWAAWAPPHLAIANSWFTARESRGIPSGTPIHVLYSPVESPASGRPDDRAQTRASLAAGNSTTVILSAARMEAWKGQHVLITALGKLPSSLDWVAWVAGGAQRRKEEQYAKELADIARGAGIDDRIHFLGQRSDVPRLMLAADVYCQPNTEPEPFGVSFVEALYSGLPVVTTAMGGALEVIDPTCGLLAPPDPDSVASALTRLATDRSLRLRLAQAAPARARALCDPYLRIQALAKVLKDVTPQRDPRAI